MHLGDRPYGWLGIEGSVDGLLHLWFGVATPGRWIALLRELEDVLV